MCLRFILTSGEDLKLLIEKLTDEILLAGDIESKEKFEQEIKKRFSNGKMMVDLEIRFNRCTIRQDEKENVEMTLEDYASKIQPALASEV